VRNCYDRISSGLTVKRRNSYLNGAKVTIVATGPMTNLALFLTLHPELYDAIEEIVFMGGGVGVGNRSAVAGASS
jgi:inosine-uridine nucleoside N-ribohydrolase